MIAAHVLLLTIAPCFCYTADKQSNWWPIGETNNRRNSTPDYPDYGTPTWAPQTTKASRNYYARPVWQLSTASSKSYEARNLTSDSPSPYYDFNNWRRYTSTSTTTARPLSTARYDDGSNWWSVRRLSTAVPHQESSSPRATSDYDRWRIVRNSTRDHNYANPSDRVMVEIPGSLATDPDVHFALSLVPMLRSRTLRDKLAAQIDILTYFRSKLTHDMK